MGAKNGLQMYPKAPFDTLLLKENFSRGAVGGTSGITSEPSYPF